MEKLSRRHLITSFDVWFIKGLTVRCYKTEWLLWNQFFKWSSCVCKNLQTIEKPNFSDRPFSTFSSALSIWMHGVQSSITI